MAAVKPLRLSHPTVLRIFKLATQKDVRNHQQTCVASGTKLVRDLSKRHHFKQILCNRSDDPALDGVRSDEVTIVDENSLRRISQTIEFSGLIGTLPQPPAQRDLGDPRLVLVLDYIEDAGLMGTLLRTALAFEWQAVFFLPKCKPDPWDPLVIRASQGALFDLPWRQGSYQSLHYFCERHGLQLCVSHANGADLGSPSYKPPRKGVALMLREENLAPFGPPREAKKVKVPHPFAAVGASPNEDEVPFDSRALDVAVAGGILMHHMKYFHYPQVARSASVTSPG
eukprot:TRINITY_DN29160_c0_g1_i4.p1 TRINITY_DN29160_c0_g1~~TRINITY_DN29160_c0_g1_i4.p1  ORF type:complete len:284 (-),score=56.32 TRINITY_DN29160_c0_g1_i4:381-1232(-)